MPKRMTDTEQWDNEWFITLSPLMKNFWKYICDKCNHAGIWKTNFSLASYLIGDTIQPEEVKKAFGDRLHWGENHIFIKKFPNFQYGPLKRTHQVHKSAILLLQKHDLMGFVTFFDTPDQPLANPCHTLKDKGKDKGKDNTKYNNMTPFQIFMSQYPKQKNWGEAERMWNLHQPPLNDMLAALPKLKRSFQWIKDDGKFIPLPENFISKKVWLDITDEERVGQKHRLDKAAEDRARQEKQARAANQTRAAVETGQEMTPEKQKEHQTFLDKQKSFATSGGDDESSNNKN